MVELVATIKWFDLASCTESAPSAPGTRLSRSAADTFRMSRLGQNETAFLEACRKNLVSPFVQGRPVLASVIGTKQFPVARVPAGKVIGRTQRVAPEGPERFIGLVGQVRKNLRRLVQQWIAVSHPSGHDQKLADIGNQNFALERVLALEPPDAESLVPKSTHLVVGSPSNACSRVRLTAVRLKL